MKLDSWNAVRRLFEQVRELAPGEREALLGAAPGDVRREVEELLACDGEPGGFLEPLDWDEPEADLSGAFVGSYRLRRIVAAGGMGAVYEAEQAEPRRTVALKMLRSGLPTSGEVRRFRYESELLGRLRHPGIAQVFEAGTHVLEGDPQGRSLPWFAMEYVEDARSILRYADEEHLAVRQRVALFLEVCAAVQHGHERGVLHRDLKPGNILVDGAGRPKVIDFGVARALERGDDASLRTEAGAVLGTLRYMSPEQIAGGSGAADTRTDVYALGVVLYELLGGGPPHDLDGLSIVEAARVVGEREPPGLRVRVPSLAPELGWIAGKALEREPDRRYASAAELAADLRRFLADEPVEAGPPTAVYRFRKFVRRNRVLVLGAAAVLATLVLGVVGFATGMLRAQREAERALAVRRFLEDILIAPAPFERGRDVPMRDVLRYAAGEIDASFADEPLVAASLHLVVGRAFQGLGELQAAGPHVEKAHALRKGLLGASDPETLESQYRLAVYCRELGQLSRAEALITDALAILREGGLAARVPELELGLAVEYVFVRGDLGHIDECRGLFEELLPGVERVLDPDDPLTFTVWNGYARTLEWAGDLEGAEVLFRRVLEARTAALGPDAPSTLISLDVLGWNLHRQGRCAEAEGHMRAALAGFLVTNGPRHPDTARCRTMIGRCLYLQERLPEAEEMLREAVSALDDDPGETDQHTINARYRLARTVYHQGRVQEAAALCRGALAASESELPPGHHLREFAIGLLGECLTDEERFEEAEQVLLEGIGEMEQAHGPESGHVAALRRRLELLERARTR